MSYLRSRNISNQFSVQVLKSLELRSIKEQEAKKRELLINNVSDDLKRKIYQEYYGDILHKS